MERGKFGVFCPKCHSVLTAVGTQEDRPLRPLSAYAVTKQQQEDLCRYAGQTYGVPVRILRYFNVYGSRQSLTNPYTGVVSIFFSRLRAGQPISLYEQGSPLRDFVHVSDVVRANLRALEADVEPGTCINVGVGRSHSIGEVANALAKACRSPAEVRPSGEFRVGDIHSCYATIDRARKLLGYAPKTSLADGMQEFADWATTQEPADLYEKAVDELKRYGLFGQRRPRPRRRQLAERGAATHSVDGPSPFE
jgi:dTDP-L-rhamnose 4-epimerase